MSYKLIYFNVRGRAEKIRLLFAEAGKEYEDQRVQGDEWKALKPNTPLGQLPVLMYEGVMLNESVAIARFVANQLGLAGSTALEKAQMDAVVDMAGELGSSMYMALSKKDETEKNAAIKEMKEITFPKILSCFEKMLRKNKEFIVGDKISWADIAMFDMLCTIEAFGLEDVLEGYPIISAHREKIGNRPNIKKWVEERPKTQF